MLTWGVRLRMGEHGRSRAARRLLDPELVYVTAAATGRVCAMRRIASEIASAAVGFGEVGVAPICSR